MSLVFNKEINIALNENEETLAEFTKKIQEAQQSLEKEGYDNFKVIFEIPNDEYGGSAFMVVIGYRTATKEEEEVYHKKIKEEKYEARKKHIKHISSSLETERAKLEEALASLERALARPDSDKNKKNHIKNAQKSIENRQNWIQHLEAKYTTLCPLLDLSIDDFLIKFDEIRDQIQYRK